MVNSMGSPLESQFDTNRPAADRQEAIAVRAYYRAQLRGFEPGHELEDWLAAEQETDAMHGSEPASAPTPARRRKASTRKLANAADRPPRQSSAAEKPARDGSPAGGKPKRPRPTA